MAEAEVLSHWGLLAKLTLEDCTDGPLSKATEEALMEVRTQMNSAGLLEYNLNRHDTPLCILCNPHIVVSTCMVGFSCSTCWRLVAVSFWSRTVRFIARLIHTPTLAVGYACVFQYSDYMWSRRSTRICGHM